MPAMESAMIHDLPESFWTSPASAKTVMTKAEYLPILAQHRGAILAEGRLWNIRTRFCHGGLYTVSLEERVGARRRAE